MKNTIRCGWTAGLALILSTSLTAQSGLLWSHPSTGEGWTPSTVALGNGGSEVVSQFGPFFDRTRVFSGYDFNPPTPLLETNQGSTSFHHQVDSAETRDLFRRPLEPDEFKGVEAVVIDPPRAGAEAQVAVLAKTAVPVIAYVSCNPATFARDARVLVEAGYQLDWVQVVDQFRWSSHVELAARFSR